MSLRIIRENNSNIYVDVLVYTDGKPDDGKRYKDIWYKEIKNESYKYVFYGRTISHALKLAEKLMCESIAFYGIKSDLDKTVFSLEKAALESEMKIFLVLSDAYDLYQGVYKDIQGYVDHHSARNDASVEMCFCMSSVICDEADIAPRKKNSAPDFGAVISEVKEKTFVEKVMEYVNRSGKKDSEIYKPMEYSRAAYSKMMSNPDMKPKKNTAMLFCLALELTYEESMDLLARAGYTFDVSDMKELYVEACIKNGFYSIPMIDHLLYENGLSTLIKY